MTPLDVELLVAERKDCISQIDGLIQAIDYLRKPDTPTSSHCAVLSTNYASAKIAVASGVALPLFVKELDRVRARLAAIEATFATLKAPA